MRARGHTVGQSAIINGLFKMCPDKRILEHTGINVAFRTSKALKNMGVVVCSDCMQITSDQRQMCENCGNELFVVREGYKIKEDKVKKAKLVQERIPIPVEITEHGKKIRYWHNRIVHKKITVNDWKVISFNGIERTVQPGIYYFALNQWWSQEEVDNLIKLKNSQTT